MLFLPIPSNHRVWSRFNFQLRLAHFQHLFLTEPCRSLDFPFDPRLLRHVSPIERKNVILYGSI